MLKQEIKRKLSVDEGKQKLIFNGGELQVIFLLNILIHDEYERKVG